MGSVLLRVSIGSTKYHDQKQIGRKASIWLTFPYCCLQSKLVRTGTQTGQDPGSRN